MAKTVAPLLSFEAGGQIAKTQVYATWKGRPYVRRYVVPANPRTAAQTATRSAFKWLNGVWKFFPAGATAAWALYAEGFRITDRNAFLKANVSNLRLAADLDAMVISPSAKSGFAAPAIVATPGDGTLTVALTAPELPTGWTITKAYAMAIPQQDPTTDEDFAVAFGDDDAAPWSVALTDLTNATEYLVGGWFEFAKPDGSPAYGQSTQVNATPAP